MVDILNMIVINWKLTCNNLSPKIEYKFVQTEIIFYFLYLQLKM